MPEWLGENPTATIIILIGLVIFIGLLVASLFKRRGCSCGCEGCAKRDDAASGGKSACRECGVRNCAGRCSSGCAQANDQAKDKKMSFK